MATLQPNKDAEVSINEIGTLTKQEDSTTGSVSSNISFVVPTGKKWTIKGIAIALSAGTFVDSTILLNNSGTGAGVALEVQGTRAVGQVGFMPNIDITIPPTGRIQVLDTASGSVDHTVRILYQESDL